MQTLLLPPVPESLREMMRRQLAAEPALREAYTRKVRSERKLLRTTGMRVRRMQEIIAQRTQRPGSLSYVMGAWANAGEWQTLLAEVDNALASLRAAWQQVKDTEPAVQEVLRTWQTEHGGGPDRLVTADSSEYLLLLEPAIKQARRNADALVEQAMEQWGAVGTRYLELLSKTRAAAGYGSPMPPQKEGAAHRWAA